MNDLIKALQNKILITLQLTISKLGPIPNECGNIISIINSHEIVKILAFGCCLDECQKQKSYDPLIKFTTEQ